MARASPVRAGDIRRLHNQCGAACQLSVRCRTDSETQMWQSAAMYEVKYIVGGVRVASLTHAGELRAARAIAEDGIRRHRADYALIVHNKTKHEEIWPPEGSHKLHIDASKRL